MKTITHSAEETIEVGRRLAREFEPGSIVALAGDLGAGKSTLLQGVLAEMGAQPPYPSPTFIIMHQYDLPEAYRGIRRAYHVDTYRVNAEDLHNVGWDEWVSDPEGIVFVEWPERVPELVTDTARWIRLAHTPEGFRGIEA